MACSIPWTDSMYAFHLNCFDNTAVMPFTLSSARRAYISSLLPVESRYTELSKITFHLYLCRRTSFNVVQVWCVESCCKILSQNSVSATIEGWRYGETRPLWKGGKSSCLINVLETWERRKDSWMSLKWPKWPMRPNERLHLKMLSHLEKN